MWFKKRSLVIYALLVVAIFISMRLTEFDLTKFRDFRNMIDFLSQWFPMDFTRLPGMLEDTLATLAMAFLGSFLGLIIGLPLSFLAARNTAHSKPVFHFFRVALSFVRSVPEIAVSYTHLTLPTICSV